MNVYDSDRMTDALAPLGYQITDGPEGADMVILNTCHIREKASEKVFSELGRLRMMKEKARDQQGRNVMIAVAGCVAQAEGEEITASVDGVLLEGSQGCNGSRGWADDGVFVIALRKQFLGEVAC